MSQGRCSGGPFFKDKNVMHKKFSSLSVHESNIITARLEGILPFSFDVIYNSLTRVDADFVFPTDLTENCFLSCESFVKVFIELTRAL